MKCVRCAWYAICFLWTVSSTNAIKQANYVMCRRVLSTVFIQNNEIKNTDSGMDMYEA